MKTLDQILADNPTFAGLDPEWLELLAGCGRTTGFDEGERLFREGDQADVLYLIRSGHVALEFHAPQRGALLVETLGPGEVVGWSWLFPPYKWHFDARATDSVRALVFDAKCLRSKADADPALGYELMQRFASVTIDRLQHARMRLLDVYGSVPRD